MGMYAIYTAIAPPSPDELLALARDNERKTYGSRRCTVGRMAIAQLVHHVVPSPLTEAILERDLWGFLTPAATRGNHAAQLQRAHADIVVPVPLWPSCAELAVLVGAEPAHYLGNNLVMVPPPTIARAIAAFDRIETDEADYLNTFLETVGDDAVLLHWDYR
jgi:hypothetical protein